MALNKKMKAIVAGTGLAVAGVMGPAVTVEGAASQPATQPATQPSTQPAPPPILVGPPLVKGIRR